LRQFFEPLRRRAAKRCQRLTWRSFLARQLLRHLRQAEVAGPGRGQCNRNAAIAPAGALEQLSRAKLHPPCRGLGLGRHRRCEMDTDIRRWTMMPKGGHFAAMEQPESLAREIVEFFRPLRAQ
jgi:pimeloyl-ACP methyl ester carboxylesterase